MRDLFNYLPLSNRDPAAVPRKSNGAADNTFDPVDRRSSVLSTVVPDDPNIPYDMKTVVGEIADNGDFYEIMPDYARNIITGFSRMDGR